MKRLAEAKIGDTVALPQPVTQGRMSVEEAIRRRRSCRDFRGEDLTVEQVSQISWSAQGITGPPHLRAAPSAGACYPLELYLVCRHGLFRYLPHEHAVVKTSERDHRERLARAALGQAFIAEAPLTVALAAVYERTTRRYGDRGLRYVYMDVGVAAENVHLQAEALGLGSVSVGAFDDNAVARALDLPEQEQPVYLIPVGRRAGGD
ncbi:MAG: SagB/ThcOx family dehydrogenase [Armatimonadota bacterium]|nr:MAG: SagB/ThcOx family dehydrogenase [Armatimonadota bacterium]